MIVGDRILLMAADVVQPHGLGARHICLIPINLQLIAQLVAQLFYLLKLSMNLLEILLLLLQLLLGSSRVRGVQEGLIKEGGGE